MKKWWELHSCWVAASDSVHDSLQDLCILNALEAKKRGNKPSKRNRQAGAASRLLSSAEQDALLPECFQSNLSDSETEFWGFPMNYAALNLPSQNKIEYTIDPRVAELFHDNCDQDFEGFTTHEMYTIKLLGA